VAIISILAAILLPAIPRGTSRARLEAFAIEAAALLKADRNAAIRRRTEVSTQVNAAGRSIRSGATGQTVRVPNDVIFDAALASRCNQRRAGSEIVFFPSGMSCGGTVVLSRLGAGYEIRVNWLTGGVEIVPRTAS
jgi:general secretion pathway protein H